MNEELFTVEVGENRHPHVVDGPVSNGGVVLTGSLLFVEDGPLLVHGHYLGFLVMLLLPEAMVLFEELNGFGLRISYFPGDSLDFGEDNVSLLLVFLVFPAGLFEMESVSTQIFIKKRIEFLHVVGDFHMHLVEDVVFVLHAPSTRDVHARLGQVLLPPTHHLEEVYFGGLVALQDLQSCSEALESFLNVSARLRELAAQGGNVLNYRVFL